MVVCWCLSVLQVLSKGKVVTFGVGESSDISGQRQIVRFEVTPEMTPSIRLLVYYFIEGEVVADSLWMEVEGKCVNSLKVCGHTHRHTHTHTHTHFMINRFESYLVYVCVCVFVCVCVCVCRLSLATEDVIKGPSPTSC